MNHTPIADPLHMLDFRTRSSPVAAPTRRRRTPASTADLPAELLRGESPLLPEVSELDAVRHYTRLSQKNFSIDTHFYPLGSCTMKYNPRACNALAMLPQFLARHPLAPAETGQGFLACLYELQEMLKDVTGMAAVSLTPMAGAQGEFAGVAMIRAYHDARRRRGAQRNHRARCGARHQPGDRHDVRLHGEGNSDRSRTATSTSTRCAPRSGRSTAGLMLTNPSTLGVFEHTHRRHPEDRARRGRPAVLRRRQPERDPRQGQARRHGLRRDPHEPAQDLLHAARRRRSGRRAGRRGAAAAAVPAAARCVAPRRASITAGSTEARPAAIDRPPVRVQRQRRRAAARLRVRAHARPRRACSASPSSPRSTPTT